MEIENRAMVKLLNTIFKFHEELITKPAETFSDEDKMIMRIITDLKAAADKYAAPKGE